MTIRAVGFDLDSTLAVTTSGRQSILDGATEAVDGPRLARGDYLDAHAEHLTGSSRAPVFECLLADAGSDVDPARLAAAYRERIAGSLEPVPGVEDLVDRLRRTYRVGVLTNGPTRAQRDKLETLGWEAAFDATLVTGELPAGKPDAAAFEALCSALGTEPGETVYVGDSVDADVAGAAGAGLHPVQILHPGGPGPDTRAVAHVDRDRLATRLPDVLAGL